MPDAFVVAGLIGVRWREWGGADGPFGAALSGEDPVPSTASRRQRFERGEMVWAPEQDMLLSAFRLRNEVCLQWSIPRGGHEYYRCNAFLDGQSLGLHRDFTFRPIGPGSDLQLWLRLQGFGGYDFHVAGFDDDHTERGWTVPVHLKLGRVPDLAEPPFPVDDAFLERWHELGVAAGPLGQPKAAAAQFAVPGSTAWAQPFEHGQIVNHFALGPDFAMSAHQVGDAIEVQWGGFELPYDRFRVDISRDGAPFDQAAVAELGLEWVRQGRGSGRLRFSPPWGDATYQFVVRPRFDGFPQSEAGLPTTAPVTVQYVQPPPDAALEPPPPDSSPAMAFASHAVRANAIARHFVRTRRMNGPTGLADENSAIQLIAHLHVLSVDPDFQLPGELPHSVVTHTLLRSSAQGPARVRRQQAAHGRADRPGLHHDQVRGLQQPRPQSPAVPPDAGEHQQAGQRRQRADRPQRGPGDQPVPHLLRTHHRAGEAVAVVPERVDVLRGHRGPGQVPSAAGAVHHRPDGAPARAAPLPPRPAADDDGGGRGGRRRRRAVLQLAVVPAQRRRDVPQQRLWPGRVPGLQAGRGRPVDHAHPGEGRRHLRRAHPVRSVPG
jgi:hypothetical protein